MSNLNRHEPSIYLFGIVITSIIACLIATSSIAANDQPPDDFVLVRRVIDARYFKNDSFTLRQEAGEPNGINTKWIDKELRPSLNLGEVLESNIARELTVSKNEVLSKVVLREYGFGQKTLRELTRQSREKYLN